MIRFTPKGDSPIFPIRIRQTLVHPRNLLAILAYLTALVIDPGSLGGIDTARRFEVTGSLWEGTPPAQPNRFALPGIDGRPHYPYGLGQSLVMLPADLVAAPISRVLSKSPESRIVIRRGVVSLITFPLICAATIALFFELLTELGFSRNESIGGSLGILYASTFLFYSKNHQENSLLLFCFVASATSILKWCDSGARRYLVFASAAAGFMVLTRLTTLLDCFALAVFTWGLIALKRLSPDGQAFTRTRVKDIALIGIPCFLLFCMAERYYHWTRFGEFTSTYMHIQSELIRKGATRDFETKLRAVSGIKTQQDNSVTAQPDKVVQSPSKPENWQFKQPIWLGFKRNLFYPNDSIFYYDPLLLTSIITFAFGFRLLNSRIRLFFASALLLLTLHVCFYSKIPWNDAGGWGNRYCANSVQLVCLLAVPILMRVRPYLKPWVYRLGLCVIGISVIFQLESILFPTSLERTQHWQMMKDLSDVGPLNYEPKIESTWDIRLFNPWQRAVTIAALVTGRLDQWGLKPPGIDLEFFTPQFAPVQLQSILPRSACWLVWAGWLTLLSICVFLLVRLIQEMSVEPDDLGQSLELPNALAPSEMGKRVSPTHLKDHQTAAKR